MYGRRVGAAATAKFRRMDKYVDLPAIARLTVGPGVRAVMVAPADAGPEERETLANIVRACGLTEGRDARTVFAPAGATLALEGPDVRRVVVFGLRPRRLGLSAEVAPYRWSAPLGGRRYCFAEGLALIGGDLARKKRLWSTIKSLKAPPP